jgi:four helix bundle protein
MNQENKSKKAKIDFANQMQDRTKRLAVEVIKFSRKIKNDYVTYIIKQQMIRSATSVASNYRAVCRARSNNEFFSKLSIVVEEIDETNLWLEVIKEAEIEITDEINHLIKESKEITAILATSRSTYRDRYQN